MNSFNLGQFINKFIDYSLGGMRGGQTQSAQKPAPNQPTFNQNLPQRPVIVVNTMHIQAMPMQNLRMNHLASLDRALYVKDLMNLPKDMKELLTFVQKNLPQANTPQMPRTMSAMINLSEISILLQQNGKEAVNKLILAMSNASKQGIGDLSQIKDTMKLIGASVSAASQNNPAATLKSLMLLYLPWLPLQEGVGFELEIESGGSDGADSDSTLIIMISTKNYGNIKATLTLMTGNAVNVFINCSDEFPKEDLLKRLKAEGKSHSMQTSVAFETQKNLAQDESEKPQAKINMSNTSQMNPFLLLMAHSVIRHTIEIDNNATLSHNEPQQGG